MRKLLTLISIYCVTTIAANAQNTYSTELDKSSVCKAVNDALLWQKENMPDKGRGIFNPKYNGWADGVFLSAMAEWSNYDDSYQFRAWFEALAKKLNYEPGHKTINPANDIAISSMYANIYQRNPRPYYLSEQFSGWSGKVLEDLHGGWQALIPTIERLDYQMKYCPKTDDSLAFFTTANQERWCWCDALYVAAPTYALFANITGNNQYRDFMDREFWCTINTLYDKQEKLIYRDTRYIDMREKNGQKVFWGRGNGWVVGAICRVLPLLPANYPSKQRYEDLLRQLMSRLVTLQDKNGYWHTSLLDYQTYNMPETSATGFYTFALWWGINNKVLDTKTYLPYARKAWEAMIKAIQPSGMLGWVQPIGDAPENVNADKNEVYGTAAFALAGLEVVKYLDNMQSN